MGSDSDPTDSLIGSLLDGRYQIEALLGRGGMGSVYRARHIGINRLVAVKVLAAAIAADSNVVSRFSQEAKAAGGLSHQNLVGVNDFGFTPAGAPYLVMEYLAGESLDMVLGRESQLEVFRALNIFCQITDGLAYAHARGVVHRDLKPSNIILGFDERGYEMARVIDFGIAKILTQSEQALTREGEIFGSPIYMSPEQCNGLVVDARSDIYSLGCVMYESLIGQPPLRGENALKTLFMHSSVMPAAFGKRRPDLQIPPELEAIVFRCLEKSPDERFQSMGELGESLRQCREALSPAPRSRVVSKEKPSFILWGAGVFALLVIALLLQQQFFLAPHMARRPAFAHSPESSVPEGQSAEKPELKWSKLDLEAQDAVDKGDYESARGLYGQCLELARSLGDEYDLSSIEGIDDLNYLAGHESGLGVDIHKLMARVMDTQSILAALASVKSAEDAATAVEQACRIAALLNTSGRFGDTRKVMERAISVAEQNLPGQDKLLARSYLSMADSYRINRLDQTESPELDYRLKAYAILKKQPQDELFQTCAYSVGRYYNVNSPAAKAVPYLKEARESASRLFGPSSKQVAKCCYQLSVAYKAMESRAFAVSYASECRTLLRALPAEERDADTYHLLASLSEFFGDKDEASREYRRSLHEFERGTIKNYPLIANCCLSLAELQPDGSNTRVALLKRRLVILARIGDLSAADEARILDQLSYSYYLNKNQAEEEKVLLRAVDIVSRMKPHTAYRASLVHCADFLSMLYLRNKDLDKALKYALLCKKWTEEESITSTITGVEADSQLGSVYIALNRVDEGRRLLEKALDFYTNYKPKAIEVQTCRSARAKLEAVLKESNGAEGTAKGGEQK